jgi:hypothetical protein
MHVETQIKNRPDRTIPWCGDLGPDHVYTDTLNAIFREDGRLINVVRQVSEDQLQSSRTMIFRDKAARDAYFADPIVAVLDAFVAEYDRANAIRSRTVVDSAG